MTTRILLSTTSYPGTPGSHHDLLESQGWDIVRVRGLFNEEQMLEIAGDFDGFLYCARRDIVNTGDIVEALRQFESDVARNVAENPWERHIRPLFVN